MQVAQEFKWHLGEMKLSARRWRQYRFPKTLMAIFIVLAFVGGWLGGWSRGITDGNASAMYMSTFMQSAAAEQRVRGKNYLAEKFHAQAVDRLVSEHVNAMNLTRRQLLWRIASPGYWLQRKHEATLHESLVRFAERRLALVPTPRAETRDELRRLGQLGQENIMSSWFGERATQYSTLLGREIRAEQLIPDAYLREHIENMTRTSTSKP